MIRITTLAIAFFLCNLAAIEAQSLWKDIEPEQMRLPAGAEVQLPLQAYRSLELDFEALKKSLSGIPHENELPPLGSNRLLELPLPDGGTASFRLVENAVMPAGMVARYPNIRTFKGVSAVNPAHQVRLGYGPTGFYAVFNTGKDEVFIERYATRQTDYYVSYYLADVSPDALGPLGCGFDPEQIEEPTADWEAEAESAPDRGSRNGQPVELYTYRFAIVNTGEFAVSKGFTTVDEVMSAYVEILNVLNGLLESSVAIRLEMIPGNDALIYLDPATDPFTNASSGGSLLSQSAPAIHAIYPPSAYDVAHVFTGPCSDVGGVVSGATCGGGKAEGVTCFFGSNILGTARGTLAHEIGHQFSASHSWSNCPGSLGQLASGWAYEPGSGSTILSYAGACGNENLSGGRLPMYNIGSLVQMNQFSRQTLGATCAEVLPTGNTQPEVSLPYENGFSIPIETPFKLEASATDADGDTLTYSWEQYNLGPIAPLGDPIGNGPSFRTFFPVDQPTRVFPRWQSIVTNFPTVEEVLPTYDRNLTFRCVVRDNNATVGGTVWAEVSFEATESAGPFTVLSPNTGGQSWTQGEYREVTWDVANTDNDRVNCQLVNIKLSVDGGYTYPYTLLAESPNDGSAFVTVPKVLTDRARIMVEAADNIFFDISNANFEILPATEPGYALELDPVYRRTCLPGQEEILIRTDSLLGFSNPISLEVVSELPEGVTAGFTQNNLMPSDSTLLQLDFSGVDQSQEFELEIRAIAADADTAYRTVEFRLVSNDHDELTLDSPVNGESGIVLATDFAWTPSLNAENYRFELATSPAFGSSLIESAEGIVGNSYSMQSLLEENTLYYWRVQPVNECGNGEWTLPNAFHTVNALCSPVKPSDTPISISGTGTPTVESTLFVPTTGIINDLNIPRIIANYQPVNSLRISLVSPSGSSVVLFDEDCGNTINFNMGFDDDAPSSILCPPDDGIVVKPAQPLSTFAGESLQGQWRLRIQVVSSGFGAGGGLDDWELEFCANVDPINPVLITNDTLFTPPAAVNTIPNTLLRAEDPDNSPDELTFNLVAVPEHGELRWFGSPLQVGDSFKQSNIDAFGLTYAHNGDDNALDQFVFTLQDGTGGWLPNETFQIKMDADATVSTEEPIAEQPSVRLFPNPARDQINLFFERPYSGRTEVRLFNVQGQLLQYQPFDGGQQLLTLSSAGLPGGLYIVHILQGDQLVTKRVSIQR